ncbi:MAG: hypothetical protein ACP5QK_07575 [Myxococcota bacterium]
MAHTGYTIQMKIKMITLHLLDGSTLNGQIFVSEYSPRHAGEEKIDEFFEQDTLFFPFKINNEFMLFSKNSVLFIEYDTEKDLSIYNRVYADIILSGGKVVSLSVPISVSTPVARLSDQVNQKEKFLLLTDENLKKTYLINKSHIISIRERSR